MGYGGEVTMGATTLKKILKQSVIQHKQSNYPVNPSFIVIETTRACLKKNINATVEDVYKFTLGWAKKNKPVRIRKFIRDNEELFLVAIEKELSSQTSISWR